MMNYHLMLTNHYRPDPVEPTVANTATPGEGKIAFSSLEPEGRWLPVKDKCP